jgi:hypothetical protein
MNSVDRQLHNMSNVVLVVNFSASRVKNEESVLVGVLGGVGRAKE